MAPRGRTSKMTATERAQILGPNGRRRLTADSKRPLSTAEACETTTERSRRRLQRQLQRDRKRKANDARALHAERQVAVRENFERLRKSMTVGDPERAGKAGCAVSGIVQAAAEEVGGEGGEASGSSLHTCHEVVDMRAAEARTDGATGESARVSNDEMLDSPKIPKKRKITTEIVQSLVEDIVGGEGVPENTDKRNLTAHISGPEAPLSEAREALRMEERQDGGVRGEIVEEAASTTLPGGHGHGEGAESEGAGGEKGVQGESIDEKVKRFVKAHSTIDTCLRSVPEDVELCGLWKGLVVSFETMFGIAQKYANGVGEELRCRQDRTGTAYQQIVCVHAGKAQRRVPEEAKKRKRPCKRTDCSWRAIYKVLNFMEAKSEHPDATPKEVSKHYVCKITHWEKKHQGHIPVRLLPSDVVQIMRHGSEVARLYGKDIALFYTSGVKIAQIQRLLQQKYGKNIESKGIHNALKSLFPPLGYDAKNLVSKITHCIREGKLAPESGFGQDEDCGILNYAFFVTSRKKKMASQMMDVVLFDTTYKVTRYDFSLAIFTGIDPEYRSRWLASALIMDESEASFLRVFKDFCSVFGGIRLLMTDDAHAIESAVSKMPEIHAHGLCGWHIAKNLSKKLKPRLRGREKEQLIHDYLMLARCGKQQTFNIARNKYLEKYTPPEEKAVPGPAVSYIKELLFTKYDKWAAHSFAERGILTLGVESTQRAETMNRIIKRNSIPTFPLEMLVDTMIEIDEKEAESSIRLESLYNAESHVVASRPDSSLLERLSSVGFGHQRELSKLVRNYSRWSLTYAIAQVSKSLGLTASADYSIMNLRDVQQPDGGTRNFVLCTVSVTRAGLRNHNVTKVTFSIRDDGLIVKVSCDCLAPQQLALPCRHMFCAYSSISQTRFCFRDEDGEVVKARPLESRAFLFKKVSGRRWKWRGEPTSVVRAPNLASRSAKLLHREIPVVDFYGVLCEQADTPASDIGFSSSEIATRKRYNFMVSAAKDIASFASPDPSLSAMMEVAFKKILKDRFFFQRSGSSNTRPSPVSAAILAMWERMTPNITREVEPNNGLSPVIDSTQDADVDLEIQQTEAPQHRREGNVRGNELLSAAAPGQVREVEEGDAPAGRSEPAVTEEQTRDMQAPLTQSARAHSFRATSGPTEAQNGKKARTEPTPSGKVQKQTSARASAIASNENTSEEIIPFAQQLSAVKNPPPRRVRGPSRNSHRQTHRLKRSGRREFGAPLRVRDVENMQSGEPFPSDDRARLLEEFLDAIHLTSYGDRSGCIFQRDQVLWPCLVQMLGGKCTSARARGNRCSFKGLNGMKRHMRVAHDKELVDFAKEYLLELDEALPPSPGKVPGDDRSRFRQERQRSTERHGIEEREMTSPGCSKGPDASEGNVQETQEEVGQSEITSAKFPDEETDRESAHTNDSKWWAECNSDSEPSLLRRERQRKVRKRKKKAEKARLRKERILNDDCSSTEKAARMNFGYYDFSPSYWQETSSDRENSVQENPPSQKQQPPKDREP